MKIVFLGTNGWYDTKTGNTICTLIETEKYFIILDAGNGLHKIDQFIPDDSEKPIYLFLSHFHMDHINGLHILNKFNFKQIFNIYSQEGTIKILDKIITHPFTVPFDQLPFKVEIHEISEGKHNIPFNMECRFLIHASKCLGYRFEIDGKVISYCTDTGICDAAIKLARNSDLLITECSIKHGNENQNWPHLDPEDAVKIAKQAKTNALALTHFDASIYCSIEERMEIRQNLKNKFRNLFIAYDSLEIEI